MLSSDDETPLLNPMALGARSAALAAPATKRSYDSSDDDEDISARVAQLKAAKSVKVEVRCQQLTSTLLDSMRCATRPPNPHTSSRERLHIEVGSSASDFDAMLLARCLATNSLEPTGTALAGSGPRLGL